MGIGNEEPNFDNLASNVRQNRQKAPPSKVRFMADGRKWLSDKWTGRNTCSGHAAADGRAVNEARAMRVAEVMNDFHLIQRRMAQYEAAPSPAEYHEEASVILRQCQAEARSVLAAPFQTELLQVPRAPGEAEKRQLQR